ncbi:MAG: RNA-binding S4 domain-containing protein [Betaproteobacteria bacterium]
MSRASDAPGEARVRIDLWLWAARFYKTRSLASDAVVTGQARVGGERVKPARALKVGDRVTLRRDALVWDVLVTALASRRGSASDAARLYHEDPASAAARSEEIARRRAAVLPRLAGRPTKRDRRALKDFLDER